LKKNNQNIINTENVRCDLLSDLIFYAFYKPHSLNDVPEMEIVFNEYNKVAGSEPLKVIVEFGKLSSITKEARDYLEKHKVKAICEAIVINNLAQRLIMSFYIKVKSHNHPSKVFKNKKNALKWVNSY
jgi:hypothetical protein